MKILVYGAGVQGSFLAHTFDDGGHDVTILARGNRATQLRESGVAIKHHFQRKTTVNKVEVVEVLKSDDFYDLIFVTMKYNDFESVLPILAQNVSENIVLVGNNMACSEMLEYIKTNSPTNKNVAFGFQVSGGIRTDEHVVAIRFDGGEMKVGSLTGSIPFKWELQKAFEKTKYKLTYETNIDAWLKNHGAMIPAMTFPAFIKNNDVKAVAKDKQLLKEVVGSMCECYDILEALGYDLIPQKQADFFRNHRNMAFWFFKIYHSLPLAKLIAGDIGETKKICDDLYKMKEGLGLQTPNLDSLVSKVSGKE